MRRRVESCGISQAGRLLITALLRLLYAFGIVTTNGQDLLLTFSHNNGLDQIPFYATMRVCQNILSIFPHIDENVTYLSAQCHKRLIAQKTKSHVYLLYHIRIFCYSKDYFIRGSKSCSVGFKNKSKFHHNLESARASHATRARNQDGIPKSEHFYFLHSNIII